MKRHFALHRILLGLTLATLGVASAKPVIVGSKLDPEAQLLGQIILLTLEDAGIDVVDRTTLGDTGVNRKAIMAGEIHVYPEYTGNAVYLFPEAKISPADSKNPARIYALAKKLDAANGITWLKPASANNTWAIAVPAAFAKQNKLVSLTDLARYLNRGGAFKIAGSPEFFNRPDTMPSFEQAYGFKLKANQKLILAGATPPQTQSAASRGTNGVNGAMAYGTDGSVAALKLVVLTDPKGAQPVYQPAPIIRADVLKAYPQIEQRLNKVFATLDQATLQRLNGLIAVEGKSAREVAQTYLKDKKLVK